jgi:hypothetical protein
MSWMASFKKQLADSQRIAASIRNSIETGFGN